MATKDEISGAMRDLDVLLAEFGRGSKSVRRSD